MIKLSGSSLWKGGIVSARIPHTSKLRAVLPRQLTPGVCWRTLHVPAAVAVTYTSVEHYAKRSERIESNSVTLLELPLGYSWCCE